MKIDLHCHSNFSDGALDPGALLAKALDAGIEVLALTDHDTMEGMKALQEIHKSHNDTALRLINGIELSARWKKHDIHILGLNVSLESQALEELIDQQRQYRSERAVQIAERMALLGIENAFEKACKVAGHSHLARPHFAKVFMDEGHVKDMQSAFKRFLGRGKPAFVPTQWISLTEAIEGIHEAGGQAVLAHPLKYSLTRTKLHELIVAFRVAGGDALEVVSGEMTTTEIEEIAGLCLRYSLGASSGSDFHAESESRISLGQQKKLPLHCIPVWNKWNL